MLWASFVFVFSLQLLGTFAAHMLSLTFLQYFCLSPGWLQRVRCIGTVRDVCDGCEIRDMCGEGGGVWNVRYTAEHVSRKGNAADGLTGYIVVVVLVESQPLVRNSMKQRAFLSPWCCHFISYLFLIYHKFWVHLLWCTSQRDCFSLTSISR